MRLVAIAFVLGIFAARILEGWPVILAGSALLVGAMGLLLVRMAPRLGVSLVALCVGATCATPLSRASPALFDGKPWVAIARVDGMPKHGVDDVVPIVVERVHRDEAFSARARLRLRTPRLLEPLSPGDRVVLESRFVRPRGTCNPGACEGIWRAAADDIDGTAMVRDPQLVLRIDEPSHGWAAWLWALRDRMRANIERRIPEEEGALVAALVAGERGGLDDDLEARFRAAGVTHLLSVSGLHLAFAAGLLFALVRVLLRRLAPELGRRRPRDRWAAMIALPIVLAYAQLTGAEVATMRAAIVTSYAFIALVLGRRLRAPDALAFAALVLLVPRPAYALDPSFQLSFVAAMATLSVGGVLPRAEGRLGRITRFAAQLVLVSFAATIATAPITALHFSQIAPMGVVSNVVAVPLTELLIVPVGLVGAITNAGPVLDCAGFCAWLLLRFVERVSFVAPVIAVAAPSLLDLLVSATSLIWLARAPSGRRLIVASLAMTCLLLLELAWSRAFPAIELAFLDVGQGDAAVIVLPGHHAIVVDGGPNDSGRRIVAPYLARRGVHRIDLMILSHAHPDHAGGLAALIDQFPVGELWTNGQDGPDPATHALVAAAMRARVPIVRPHPMAIAGVELAPIPIAFDPLASENDNSLVVTMRYAGRRMLFAGDIERDAEEKLVATRPPPVDVVKVPHHGSRTSSSDELLDALHPRLAVASLADGNRYRFPHPDVVERYRRRSIDLHRTDLDGAVVVRITRSGALSVARTRPGEVP